MIIPGMQTPTFRDFFRSFYYSTTYLPPVDVSTSGVSKYLLETEDRDAARKIQRLISHPDIQTALDPVKEHKEISEIFKKHNVNILNGVYVLYNSDEKSLNDLREVQHKTVLEYEDTPGYVIKVDNMHGSSVEVLGIPDGDVIMSAHSGGVFRIEMACRISRIARQHGIDVVVPKKRLVTYARLDDITGLSQQYCVVCEKMNVLSAEETVESIEKMPSDQQVDLAKKISRIVRAVGFSNASFDTIRLTPEGKIAFISTQPSGVLVAQKSGLLNKIFTQTGASIEKSSRIGLHTLSNSESIKRPGLAIFQKQLKDEYDAISHPQFSRWKIAISVMSLGIIPLVHVIVALVKTRLIKQILQEYQKIGWSLHVNQANMSSQSVREHLEKITRLTQKFYATVGEARLVIKRT